MNNEAMNPFINRVDDWENRIDTTEDQKGKKGRWLMDKVYKVGSMMGLLGVPGALVGVVTLLDWYNARPDIGSDLGQDLTLSSNQARQLDLKSELILNNIGDAKDIVTVKRAYVISYGLDAQEPNNIELGDIRVSEKGASIHSISVKADEIKRVDINSRSKQRAFLETGHHKLVLELNLRESEKRRELTYCFLVGKEVIESLLNNTPRKYNIQDEGCPSGGQ
jgi:hypothetical protein